MDHRESWNRYLVYDLPIILGYTDGEAYLLKAATGGGALALTRDEEDNLSMQPACASDVDQHWIVTAIS
jgi:hypothetical protein